jgi:hypothetical protein
MRIKALVRSHRRPTARPLRRDPTAGRRHPCADARNGARGLLLGLEGEEAAWAVPHRCGKRRNAASRVESFIQSKGAYAYGGYPDIDDLFLQQARERDPKKREAVLLKIQQLTIDRVMFAAVMDLRALMGIGPRVVKHTITDVWMSPFPSYENIEVKE